MADYETDDQYYQQFGEVRDPPESLLAQIKQELKFYTAPTIDPARDRSLTADEAAAWQEFSENYGDDSNEDPYPENQR
jgi:hypothetical protein